jgi:hypothetical protein
MRLIVVLWLLVNLPTFGQFVVRPFVMQNAFQVKYNAGEYDYGGKFGDTAFSPGLDLEYRFSKALDSLSSPAKLATNAYFALLVGAAYWKHNNIGTGFNRNGDQLYSAYSNEFIAIPLLAKYYVQLGILNEKMRMGWGLGVLGLYRLKTGLHEEAIIYTRDPVNNSIISSQTIEDERDLTKTSPQLALGFYLELSFEYDRFYFALRAFQSGGDQYSKGIENQWNLTEAQSIYLQAYKDFPKITYEGGGLLIGWRINRAKQY